MVDASIILNHILVPKHEVMTKKATEDFLKKSGLKREDLPRILETDAVIEAIKAKKGDVLKITRQSMTAGEAVYYRAVY